MSEGMIVRRGGAGSGIAIKIKGGTTAPANPTENLVWVNTSETITKTIVSYDEPESPTAGTVWIKPADNGNNTVSLSRRDTVVLRVGVVSQYISSAWVGKDTHVYVSGSWVPIQEWVYNNGTKYSEFTPQTGSNGMYSDESATNGYLRLYDKDSASGWKNACVYTSELKGTKDAHALHVTITPTNINGYFDIGVCSTKTSSGSIESNTDALAYIVVQPPGTTGADHTFVNNQKDEWVCDISGVSQDGYIAIHTGSKAAGVASARIKIHEIWLT